MSSNLFLDGLASAIVVGPCTPGFPLEFRLQAASVVEHLLAVDPMLLELRLKR